MGSKLVLDDPEEAERRQWTLPEEELPPCITARRQPGEHRWFRSLRPIGGGRWTYGPRQAGGALATTFIFIRR